VDSIVSQELPEAPGQLPAVSSRASRANSDLRVNFASQVEAQDFQDFNPNSTAQPYVWRVAAAVPAVVAHFPSRAGKHLLPDNQVGYAVGATVGMVGPRLHRVNCGYDAVNVPA